MCQSNFLTQVTEEPTRRGAMLDFVLTNKEELVLQGTVSDLRMVEIKILRAVRRAHSKITAPDIRRADLWPLQGPAPKCPGKQRGPRMLPEFQGSLPPSSGSMDSSKREIRKISKRPSWMDKELLSKLRVKNKAFRKGKQEQTIQEEYREIVLQVRDKAQLELDLSRDIKDNRKGFLDVLQAKENQG